MPKQKTKARPKPQARHVATSSARAPSANATPSPRKRLRASAFAVRSSSSKRRGSNTRRRLEDDLDGESPATSSIDRLLRNARKITGQSTANADGAHESVDLAEAFKRAEEMFKDDVTDTSSTDDDNNNDDDNKADGQSAAVKSVKSRYEEFKKRQAELQEENDDVKKVKGSAKKKKRATLTADNAADRKEVKKLQNSIHNHKKDIESLKQDDPDFYKYLEENDSALLDLDDLDLDEDDDDEDEDEDARDSDSDSEDDEEDSDGDEKVKDNVNEEDALRTVDSKKDTGEEGLESDGDSESDSDSDSAGNEAGDSDNRDESKTVNEINTEKLPEKQSASPARRKDLQSVQPAKSPKSENVDEESKNANLKMESPRGGVVKANDFQIKHVDVEEENEDSEGDSENDRESSSEDSDDEDPENAADESEKYGSGSRKGGESKETEERKESIEVEEKVESDESNSDEEAMKESDEDDKIEKEKVNGEKVNGKDISEKNDEDESDSDDSGDDSDKEKEENENDGDAVMKDAPGADSKEEPKPDQKTVDDRTGYSDSEDESDDEEAEAAAEAGISNGVESDDEEEQKDEEFEEPEPMSEEDGEDSKADGEEEIDDDDFDMTDDVEKTVKSRRKGSEVTVVDLPYLRELRDRLKSKRALSACKELLKVFRAGRNIVPKSVNDMPKGKDKEKQRAFANRDVIGKVVDGRERAHGDEEEMSDIEEEYNDEAVLTVGKVRFVSAKAYQQAMNLAIIGIQDGIDRMLGKPHPDAVQQPAKGKTAKWNPTQSKRWYNLQPLCVKFMECLIALCEQTSDPITLRFLLKRLERTTPYMVSSSAAGSAITDNGDGDGDEDDDDDDDVRKDGQCAKLSKRVVKTAVRVWSSDAHVMSDATRLQAYLLLNCVARVNSMTEVVLRACYHAYFSNIAATCNHKSLPLINFSVACMVELFGLNMGASYATGFSYIRELAMGLRSVLVSKDSAKDVERVHNWSFVNQLRLWSRVLARYGDPAGELHPLVYPFVQVAIGVIRAYPSPRTFPLRVHIAGFLNRLVSETGTFIPVVQQMVPLLRCTELKKRHFTTSSNANHSNARPNNAKSGGGGSKSASGGTAPNAVLKKLDWRCLLRVSDDVVKSKLFLTALVDHVTLEIARFFATIARHVSFPELGYVAETALRKAARDMSVPEWKARVVGLAVKLQETSKIVMQARAKADDFSPHTAVVTVAKGSKKKTGSRISGGAGNGGYGMLQVVAGLQVAAHERASMKKKTPVERWLTVEKQRMDKEYALRDEAGGIRDDLLMEDDKHETHGRQGRQGKQGKKRKVVEHDDNDDEDENGSDSNDEDEGEVVDRSKKTKRKKKERKTGRVSFAVPPVHSEADVVGKLNLVSESESE